MASQSQPYHRREAAVDANADASGRSNAEGPLVAMKAADLDALSPRSAEHPPNFLEYAQTGAADIQSQMPPKDSSAMESSGDKNSLSGKLTQGWEVAKEKVNEAWNAVVARSATASRDRVEQMKGGPDTYMSDSSEQRRNYPLTSTPDHDKSTPDLRPSQASASASDSADVAMSDHTSKSTGRNKIGARGNVADGTGSNFDSDPHANSTHTSDMSTEGRARREQEQRARESQAVSSSSSRLGPTTSTNELEGRTGRTAARAPSHTHTATNDIADINQGSRTNIAVSSSSGIGSEMSSTHSLNSTKIGDDGQEHLVQSSYTIREVPLPDGKVEVREQWADRQDDEPVKVKQVRRVVEPKDLDKV
jgi:hypothetical protein